MADILMTDDGRTSHFLLVTDLSSLRCATERASSVKSGQATLKYPSDSNKMPKYLKTTMTSVLQNPSFLNSFLKPKTNQNPSAHCSVAPA